MMAKAFKKNFELVSTFQPGGDQPKAIETMVENFSKGLKHQTLLGVTGSGKTFSMAHTIAHLNCPAIQRTPAALPMRLRTAVRFGGSSRITLRRFVRPCAAASR